MSFSLPLDPGRALLAIALASALWFVIQNDENPDRTSVTDFRVPVELVNVPAGLVQVGESPSVQLRVRVPTDAWPRLRAEMFRATADASEATGGGNEVPVAVERLDSAIRAAEPVPARALVLMEEIREASVPVKVNIVGSVPFGYSYQPPRPAPDRVTVAGPASRIQRVESVITEIRLDGITVSVNASYAPRPVDSRGAEVSGVRITPSAVTVAIEVSQQVAYKEVGVRPRMRGRTAAGYVIDGVDVEPASVTVVGEPQALSEVNFVETQGVELGNASSTAVRRVQLAPPTGIGLLQTQPVAVTVRISPLIASQTVRVTPTVQGLGPGLLLAGDVPAVDLTISGPTPTLRGLAPNAFGAILNLAGLGAGRQEVAPRVTVPSGFQLESIEPSLVVVVLRPAEAISPASTQQSPVAAFPTP